MTLPLTIVWIAAAGLLGLNVGSFVNVLIFRLPRNRSVVWPGSHCFHCGTELTPRDLVPVLSYLLSGGRCRYCGVFLSSQYAWVEFACGLLYAGLAWRWSGSLGAVIMMLATAAMLGAFGTDVRHKIIPTSLNTTVFVAGLGGSLIAALLRSTAPDTAAGIIGPWGLPSPGMSLLGAVVGYAIFEAIVRGGRWIFQQEAMGGGDVLLAGAVGALFGPGRWFATFFLVGIVSGAVLGVALMLTGRLSRREPIPFGPFLIGAAIFVMLFPALTDTVAGWYGFSPSGGVWP